MEANNTSLSLVEISEVVASVKRLYQLSGRMRTPTFGFNETDIAHIDSIIDALHELDLCKTKAKDTLETETIKCAAVRHKLMHYPDEINSEIHEAVQAARIVNEETIDRIKTQLEQLSNEFEKFERLTDVLDTEIDKMKPDLAAMKAEFDANFARMNDLLAEKSAEQIRLNDDRESVRWASARIVELEEDWARLAVQMAEEREAHGNTMQGLLEETEVAEQQLRDRTQKEDKVRREFLAVHSELQESAGVLEEATELHRTLEHDSVILQVEQQDTRRQQMQQLNSKEQLKNSIEVLTTQTKSLSEDHRTQMIQLTKTVEELDTKTQNQAVQKEKVAAQKLEVAARTETLQVKEEVAKKIQDVSQDDLQKARQDLADRQEDMGRMRQDIIDIDGRRAELEDAERAEKEGWLNPSELLESGSQHLVQFMESIKDSQDVTATSGDGSLPAASVMEIQDTIEMHRRRRQQRETRQAKDKPELFRRATEFDLNSVLGLNKQIAELKEKVEHERGKRLAVQATSEKLQAAIGQFNASESAQAKEINDLIESLKREKIALDEEQSRLLAKAKTDEAKRAGLAEQLAAGRRQLAEALDIREAEAERLQREAERMREERAAKTAEVAELEPKFDEFRSFFERSTGEYEALKRSLVALKGRKAGLEESSRRADQEIGRLTGEIAGLRRDRERRVAQSSRQMEDIAGDRVHLEKAIYVLGCKLTTVLHENAKLEAGIDRLEREMRSMRDTWEWAVPAKARIDEQRARETRQFQAGRLGDSAMEAEFQADDRRLLAALAVIVSDTEARRAILEAVTGGLDSELDHLSDYLKTSADQSE